MTIEIPLWLLWVVGSVGGAFVYCTIAAITAAIALKMDTPPMDRDSAILTGFFWPFVGPLAFLMGILHGIFWVVERMLGVISPEKKK